MAKAFAATLLILLGMVAFVVYRTGYFKPVTITSGQQGPFFLAYKTHEGPYHKIAPVIDGVEQYFKSKNIDCPFAFGRYLHDPNTVPHDRLLSHGGCVFPILSSEVKAALLEGELQLEEVEKKEYLVAHFEGSPSVGPLKVYPYVQQWLEKYGYKQEGPVIELYQTTGEDAVHTRYLFQYR